MTQKQKHIVILLVVAALVAVSVFLIVPPGKKTHLGLDLQGGLEVVYDARTPSGGTPTSAQLSQTVSIMQKRVNGMGTTEAQVQQQGTDQIAVSLPGETNFEHALATIGQTAQLEFFVDYTQRVAGPVAQGAADPNSSAAVDAAIKAAVAELRKKARNGTSPVPGGTVSVPPSQYTELGQLSATNKVTQHFELVNAPPRHLRQPFHRLVHLPGAAGDERQRDRQGEPGLEQQQARHADRLHEPGRQGLRADHARLGEPRTSHASEPELRDRPRRRHPVRPGRQL